MKLPKLIDIKELHLYQAQFQARVNMNNNKIPPTVEAPIKIEPNPDINYLFELYKKVPKGPYSIDVHKPNDQRVMVYSKDKQFLHHYHPIVGHKEETPEYRLNAEFFINLHYHFEKLFQKEN